MKSRPVVLFLVAVVTSLVWNSSLFAQTTGSTTTATTPKSTSGAKSIAIVYHLTFDPNGDSINFRNYTNGYYVADAPTSSSSSGTLILMQVVSGVRKYYTYEDYGGMFVASKGSERKGVLVGSRTAGPTTSGTTTASTTFTQNITLFGIGDAKESVEIVNPAVSDGDLIFPEKLEGTAIFADSQRDYPFAFSSGVNIGTAGALKLIARYDAGLSAKSLKLAAASRNDLVSSIWTLLKDQGYVDGSTTTTSTTTTTR